MLKGLLMQRSWSPQSLHLGIENQRQESATLVTLVPWIRSLTDAVDVFGEGDFMSAFVGGAELDGEAAFKDLEEVSLEIRLLRSK